MKRIIISVRGGVADIQENESNASILIVDWDNENEHEMVKSKNENDIVIEVLGGVATCSQKPSDVEVEIIDHDEQATCAFCGRDYPETEINMVDYDDDICTFCEREQLANGNLITYKNSGDIDKLINALSQFENCAKEIKRIWLETDAETHSNLCDDYPFDKDFEEVAENIGKWVFTQQKLLKG
ncbi:hypothetical protein [Bacillus sp. MSP13]|uniref:hypothetical protein n=1 Tax=Bacillus sp. MSP13 TaxID=1071061 RepID=UPI001E4B5279|nr:hypothetical protein [Bacillus sp. MSP13]